MCFVALLAVAAAIVLPGADAKSDPARLTTEVPAFVTRVCASASRQSPIRLVCPPLVPVTRSTRIVGLYGTLLGSQGRPRLGGLRTRLYLVSFNHGDLGPGFVHWVAGMGSAEAVRYWILSDVRNVVRGKPRLLRVINRGGRAVEVWRFPEHPAGGQFGGHIVAIAEAKTLRAVASIHGYDTEAASVRMAIALAAKADRAKG